MKIFNIEMRRRRALIARRHNDTGFQWRWLFANSLRYLSTYSDSSCGDVEIKQVATAKPDSLWGNFRYFPIGE